MVRAFPPRPGCSSVPTVEAIPLDTAPINCPTGAGGGGGGSGSGGEGSVWIPPAAAPISEATRKSVGSPHNTSAATLLDTIPGRNKTSVSPLTTGMVVGIHRNDADSGNLYEDVLGSRRVVELEDIAPSGVKIYQHVSWGVVQSAELLTNAIGPIKIAGITFVNITVVDSTHQFARLETGQTYLISCQYGGHARILWRDSVIGKALILFPHGQLPTFGVATSTAAGGTVNVEVGGLALTDVATVE